MQKLVTVGVFLGTAALAACSFLRPSCDSPAVLEALRRGLAGVGDTELKFEQTAWLEKAVQVTVLKEQRDDSGRHLTCVAHLNIPKQILTEGNPILAIYSAFAEGLGRMPDMTINYSVSSAFDADTTVVLTPVDEDENNVLRLIRMSLQPKLMPNAATERVTSATKDIADAVQTARGPAPGPVQAENIPDLTNYRGGRYHRESPASDLTITSNGDNNWHITILGAGPALGENTPADCQLDADGHLEQGQINAEFDSTGGDGKVVVKLTATGAVVPSADVSGCGRHSDLTGEYSRMN